MRTTAHNMQCAHMRASPYDVMTALHLPTAGRAFRIHRPAADHRIALEKILTAPNIDWRFQESDVEHDTTHWEALFRGNLEHPLDARDFQLYGSTNLSLVGADMRTVWWSANAGDLQMLVISGIMIATASSHIGSSVRCSSLSDGCHPCSLDLNDICQAGPSGLRCLQVALIGCSTTHIIVSSFMIWDCDLIQLLAVQ